MEAKELFHKYKKLVFVYPEYTHHPFESVQYFRKFCSSNHFNFEICTNSRRLKVEKNVAYISVNDRILYELLDQSGKLEYEIGQDVGILSYNDTPLKKFTYKGITVASIDFKEFGAKASQFISGNEGLQVYLKTKLIQRDSL